MTTPFALHHGDCLDVLRGMESASANTCITSPPYFGLRDYGHGGQIGLEQTPGEFVAKLVDVFREVRRVLRDDGTLWLNLGDSYAAQGGPQVSGTKQAKGSQAGAWGGQSRRGVSGVKPKDLIGIPWRVAFALQADGWYLRQDIIWHKPNPMPESVRDRCTKAHEYVFLLSKSERYYFDADSIKEPAICGKVPRKATRTPSGNMDQRGVTRVSCAEQMGSPDGMRNRRSVWTVATKPFRGAHFATFPPDLIAPCVLAGCPAGGVVLDPFGGAGTTALVAQKHGRRSVLIELNAEYVEIARARIQAAIPPIFGEAA